MHKPKQSDILQWAVETFGPIAANKEERVKRFAEEAIELCQSCGLRYSDFMNLVVSVYGKEPGHTIIESG